MMSESLGPDFRLMRKLYMAASRLAMLGTMRAYEPHPDFEHFKVVAAEAKARIDLGETAVLEPDVLADSARLQMLLAADSKHWQHIATMKPERRLLYIEQLMKES